MKYLLVNKETLIRLDEIVSMDIHEEYLERLKKHC